MSDCLGAQFSSVAQSCLTLRPCEPQHARPPCPSPTPGVLPKPMSVELVRPSNHLILYRPLLLLPLIFPSIRGFSNESAFHIRWPKYWSFSFNISPFNEQPGLISFRMDWLDLLAVQGSLKSLLRHHSSRTSILLHSAFFIFKSLGTHQLRCTTLDSAGDEMGPAQASVCVRRVNKASMSVISLDAGPLSVETSEVRGCLSLWEEGGGLWVAHCRVGGVWMVEKQESTPRGQSWPLH